MRQAFGRGIFPERYYRYPRLDRLTTRRLVVVPHDFLHMPEIGLVLHQVRGARVAERVGMEIGAPGADHECSSRKTSVLMFEVPRPGRPRAPDYPRPPPAR